MKETTHPQTSEQIKRHCKMEFKTGEVQKQSPPQANGIIQGLDRVRRRKLIRGQCPCVETEAVFSWDENEWHGAG